MTGLVVTIRPEPGAAATAAAGREAGIEIEAWPLSAIRPLPWEPAAGRFDALLLGSANAVRHAGPALAGVRGIPAYAVGEATAAAAVAAGLTVAATGSGGLQSLVDALPPPLRLLRLAGAERVPLAPPAGIEIATRVTYENAPLPLAAEHAARLGAGALVLLHAAAAARHFAAECDRLGVPRGAVRLAALALRIAGAAGPGWREVRAAAAPREGALLALARDMCHEPPPG
ncbi:MAG TPA: uroporphyrinogen-III synthase [Croceibacterium sp.]|nr:uroporphyrinogen-III synthase [Croceibacterium sp.]